MGGIGKTALSVQLAREMGGGRVDEWERGRVDDACPTPAPSTYSYPAYPSTHLPTHILLGDRSATPRRPKTCWRI